MLEFLLNRFLCRAFAGVLIACAGGAAAQDWKAELQRTVAAANKEGELYLLLSPSKTQREYIQAQWRKDYPAIKLSITTLPAPQFLQRIKTEREVGKYLWDVISTGTETGLSLRDSGFVDPMQPEFILPDVKDPQTWGGWDAAFFDKEKKYVFSSQSFLKMPFYNARLLSPEKVKSLGTKVFLDPALRKKVIWHEPLMGGSGRTFSAAMRRLLGDEGFTKFVREQVVFVSRQNELVERMARGQFAISLGPVMTSLIEEYQKAGVDVDIRPLGNVPELGAYANSGASNLLVAKNRPHPNAARVYLNWILSKRISAELADAMEQDSRRIDVPHVVEPAQRRIEGVSYFDPQREENLGITNEAQEIIKKLRNL